MIKMTSSTDGVTQQAVSLHGVVILGRASSLHSSQRPNLLSVMPEITRLSYNDLMRVMAMLCRYNNLDELYHSKSEEGLSRLLAFLREEEERERLEQIERMKPIGTQVLTLTLYCFLCWHQYFQDLSRSAAATLLHSCAQVLVRCMCQLPSLILLAGRQTHPRSLGWQSSTAFAACSNSRRRMLCKLVTIVL